MQDRQGTSKAGPASVKRPATAKPRAHVLPARVSVHPDGRIKDTPANRALHPVTTPQTIFESPSLLREAYYADDKSLIFNCDVSKALQLLRNEGLQVDCIVTS